MMSLDLLPDPEADTAMAVDTGAVAFGPDERLSCESLERAAYTDKPRVHLTAAAREGMQRAHEALQHLQASGAPIYGVTTGFGPFVSEASADDGGAGHGAALIAHLGAGCGPDAEAPVVRAAMMLRAQAVAQGHAGLSLDAFDAYLRLLTHGLVPAVPEVGSVGASGDLIPLAHIARVVMGEGRVRTADGAEPAAEALRSVGLTPYPLSGRDALALVNGTSFLTAFAGLAVARAERLIRTAEALTGYLYRLLGCRAAALHPALHEARGHQGQVESARAIQAAASVEGPWEDPSRPLQEIYSLRCAPQVLGACRENLAFARRLVETEMNGVNDNPLVFAEPEPFVLHGGNFQGQQVAFAADALNAALTQAAVLAERQLAAVCNPQINGGAPLLLAWQPGATSGFAGAQITATAVVAEMRMQAQAHATSSIPTNGGNQDVVSMGTLAARRAYEQTGRLAHVLATTTLAAVQLGALRRAGRAPCRAVRPPEWVPAFVPLQADRALHDDLARTTQTLLAPDTLPPSGLA